MNLSLKAKMSLAVATIIVLTGGALLTTSYLSIATETSRSIESESRATLKGYAHSIGNWFESKLNAIEGASGALAQAQEADIYRTLEQNRASGGFILSYFGTTGGDMYRNDPKLVSPPGFDPRKRGWYRLAMSESGIVTSAPFVSVTAQKTVVSVAKKVVRDGAVLGVVGANLALDRLSNDIGQMAVLGDGKAMLVDKEGLVLAHHDAKWNLKNAQEISPVLTANLIQSLAQSQRLSSQTINGQDILIAAQAVGGTSWYLVFLMDKAVLNAPLDNLLLNNLLVGAGLLLVGVILAALFISWLLKELHVVSDALKNIAQGDGDLTVRIASRSKDEVGMLAHHFNCFSENLRTMVNELTGVSSQLDDRAKDTAESAASTQAQVEYQGGEITQVSVAIEQLGTATQHIASHADQTALLSSEAVSLSQDGQHQMSQSIDAMSKLASELQQTVTAIEQLEQHSQDISTIISTINDIAEQTNLLALNAAIEAARAGEQGRGFAVVADEVRVLSHRTHQSTSEIQSMIETLQTSTQKAVESMQGSYQRSEQTGEELLRSESSLRKIGESVAEIHQMATQIATAAEEQSSVTTEISRNTSSVRDVATRLAEQANNASTNASSQKALSDAIQTTLERFKVS